MAYWAKWVEQTRRDLAGKPQFVDEESLTQEPHTFYGPSAAAVKDAFPALLGYLKLTNRPWDKGAENFHGIGVNNTYWVLHPKSDRRGVWVLNASCEEAAQNAINTNSPTQWGFYVRVTDTLPLMKDIKASGLIFAKGFTEAFYADYPEQDDRPKPPAPRPVVAVKTYEVFGMMNGEPVPLWDVLTKAGPGDYVLAEGADVVVGDSHEDGFGLGGDPGKWAAFYPGRSPADFGLDANKAVLRWDATLQKGVVLDAAFLRDLYSPENWKPKIYG